jgi:hypothetical protein
MTLHESDARRARDFWVHVHGPRAADFEKVFGTARVAVQSPIPHAARLPGSDDPQPVYLLDLEWVAADTIAEIRNAQRWLD